MKLIDYAFFAVNVASSDPWVGQSPKFKISVFLLSEELISTSKIITTLPNLLATEEVSCLSNPIPYPEYLCLSKSAFFTNLTASSKEFFSTG